MATVPLSGTNIRFLSGVPFTNDYKHTRWFDTVTAQYSYFDSKNEVHREDYATYQRIEGRTFIKVDKGIDDLWGTNYLMFRNISYSDKWFYAFVTKLEYKNASMTYVHFQIDVLQTWMFEMDFKPSYVIREHCKLWEADGSPVINTVDEGLNYGSTYETIDVMNWKPYDNVLFLVIVMKQTAHLATAQTAQASMNALPQPLCYYVHPFYKDGSEIGIGLDTPDDLGFSSALEIIDALGKNKDTVNNVVSVYVTDYIGFDVSVSGGVMVFPSTNFMQAIVSDGTSTTQFSTLYLKEAKSYAPKSAVFANKYAGYRTVKESKLLMYPYTTLIMDDLKGNRQVIKNEYIKGTDINMTVRGSIGNSNKTSYSIDNYSIKDNLEPADWFLSNLENAVINSEPNDLPIITDMLSAYLQGNRNSLNVQAGANAWNMGMGVVNGALSTVVGGQMMGGLGSLQSISQTIQGAGNGVLQIQAMTAKLQDINNQPPNLTKQGGNTHFDYGHGLNGLYLIKKQITDEYVRKLECFFGMYGYKINEVKLPNFHTRETWNYIQTASCVIAGNFNNEDLNELKAIFDNGITLWHVDDVGNYSLENGVL